MKNINGQGNEITIILPHDKNRLCILPSLTIHFDSEENVEKLLFNEYFLLIIKGNSNTVN